MFITKKHLSRRSVLKGAGYAVSLPLLDAMIPAATALANTAAAAKVRMAFVYFPHGAVMDQWTPKTEGPDFDLPPIIEPLKPFQDQLTVISGMENKSAIAAPVHAITPGTWLSCVPTRLSHEAYGDITNDHIAALFRGEFERRKRRALGDVVRGHVGDSHTDEGMGADERGKAREQGARRQRMHW